MSYFKTIYGERSKDFTEGIIAGVSAYAIWKDGVQVCGIFQKPLKDVIRDVREQMGWPEEGN